MDAKVDRARRHEIDGFYGKYGIYGASSARSGSRHEPSGVSDIPSDPPFQSAALIVRATRKPILSHCARGEMGPRYPEVSRAGWKLLAPLRMTRS
jgi:hypothetical protein